MGLTLIGRVSLRFFKATLKFQRNSHKDVPRPPAPSLTSDPLVLLKVSSCSRQFFFFLSFILLELI